MSAFQWFRYTRKKSPEEANADIEPLKGNKRLSPLFRKADTNAEALAESLSKHLNDSLSAKFAKDIRRLSTTAIENVLVKIDNLPLDVAIRLLASNDEELISDLELIEFLSTKVGDHLKSSKELTGAITEYAQKSGIEQENEKGFIDEVVDLIATAVKNNIQYDKVVYEALKSATQVVQSKKPES